MIKVIIKPHFSVKLQAAQYNPIEENGSMEIELEVENEAAAKKKYLEMQEWIKKQNIKSAFDAVKTIKKERKEAIEALEE